MFKAKIYVSLRTGVLDPQGQAVRSGLLSQGFSAVEEVRIGKFLEVTVNCQTEAEAAEQVKAMCDKLLANPVMEDYSFVLEAV